jgi:dolichyl-phosphate-mannose--protein O-mannosyl transferase
MLKPIWLFTQSQDGLISNIYAQGNPAVFWLGFIAVIVLLCVAIITSRRELWAIFIAYAGLFIPWSLSPRIMFLYHYLPSVPFLAIALAWVLTSNTHWKKTAILCLLLAVALFIWLYQHWIGIPVAEAFDKSYYAWLPS